MVLKGVGMCTYEHQTMVNVLAFIDVTKAIKYTEYQWC